MAGLTWAWNRQVGNATSKWNGMVIASLCFKGTGHKYQDGVMYQPSMAQRSLLLIASSLAVPVRIFLPQESSKG